MITRVITQHALPTPGDGQVLIRTRTIGVKAVDGYLRSRAMPMLTVHIDRVLSPAKAAKAAREIVAAGAVTGTLVRMS